MSARRPELPYSLDNTIEARYSPCPPVPWALAVFSAIAMRLVQAEIHQATRRTMPTPEPWTPVHLTCLAATGTAVLVVTRIMRGAA